jgi:hypothetical protein
MKNNNLNFMLHKSFFSKTVVAGIAIALFLAGCDKKDEDVKVALKSILVSPATTPVSLVKGETWQLAANPEPADAADVDIRWTSSATGIATVSDDGLVTAVEVGSATITASSGSIQSTPIRVDVSPKALTSFDVEPTSLVGMIVGEDSLLVVTKTPADAGGSFAFESNDDNVATVSGDGLVTAVGEGSATITITPSNSSVAPKMVQVTVPYAATLGDVNSYAGIGRAHFEITVPNTAIAKVRIYWNNRQESQDITIDEAGTYKATIDLTTSGNYDFTVVPVNSAGEESTSVKTASATVYDAASLAVTYPSARSVTKAVHYYGRSSEIGIYWGASLTNEVKTKVTYTNSAAEETVRDVPTDEIYTEITDIQDWTAGVLIETCILPEPAARDTFITTATLYDSFVEDFSQYGKVWDACESLAAWGTGGERTLSLDATDPREGSYSIKSYGKTSTILVKTFPAPFDTEVSRADGYIAFSLYVEDATALGAPRPDWKQCTLTFTSNGGTGNSNQLRLLFSPLSPPFENNKDEFFVYTLASGWNDIEVKLTDCLPSDDKSEADLSALNYLMLNCGTMTQAIDIKIDNIRFYKK